MIRVLTLLIFLFFWSTLAQGQSLCTSLLRGQHSSQGLRSIEQSQQQFREENEKLISLLESDGLIFDRALYFQEGRKSLALKQHIRSVRTHLSQNGVLHSEQNNVITILPTGDSELNQFAALVNSSFNAKTEYNPDLLDALRSLGYYDYTQSTTGKITPLKLGLSLDAIVFLEPTSIEAHEYTHGLEFLYKSHLDEKGTVFGAELKDHNNKTFPFDEVHAYFPNFLMLFMELESELIDFTYFYAELQKEVRLLKKYIHPNRNALSHIKSSMPNDRVNWFIDGPLQISTEDETSRIMFSPRGSNLYTVTFDIQTPFGDFFITLTDPLLFDLENNNILDDNHSKVLSSLLQQLDLQVGTTLKIANQMLDLLDSTPRLKNSDHEERSDFIKTYSEILRPHLRERFHIGL